MSSAEIFYQACKRFGLELVNEKQTVLIIVDYNQMKLNGTIKHVKARFLAEISDSEI